MRGIILSGGRGTRLLPLTKTISKQLLPVYHRPMIYYPLNTLLKAGISEILIIVAPEQAGHYLNALGSGKEFGAKFTYEIQDKPEGIAQALLIGETFLGNEDVALILGDNIFEDDVSEHIKSFKKGGRIFAKEVPDPERFGVVEFDNDNRVLSIVEKPKTPKSSFAIPGLYIYDNRAIQFAKEAKPSARGELEIVDIHNRYLTLGELDVRVLNKEWIDAGTFDSLHRANQLAKEKLHKNLII
ncbi:MAG: sugar phosphate nucleotidyltransferase [Candidatus Spechtbacterales bacterium]